MEDAIYDSQAIRHFVGIDLNSEAAPDATTLLKFRHLLEAVQSFAQRLADMMPPSTKQCAAHVDVLLLIFVLS